ncbi:hypothetical protein CAY92_35170 [Pseudomonas aeruginosa]|nr:hypothetical protein CAY92_35170 [Pseudomonas aeruginosa]
MLEVRLRDIVLLYCHVVFFKQKTPSAFCLVVVGSEMCIRARYSKGLGPTVAALRDELEPTQILEKLDFSAAADGALLRAPGGGREVQLLEDLGGLLYTSDAADDALRVELEV